MWETSEERAAAQPSGIKYLCRNTSKIPQGQKRQVGGMAA